jgi:DNA-directed RNA polymerase specialized sigma24 family protein
VSVLRDFDLAQDLAQETFLKVFQHLDRLATPERFGNWLRIIAVNECRLYLRRARAAPMFGRTLYTQVLGGQAHLTPSIPAKSL